MIKTLEAVLLLINIRWPCQIKRCCKYTNPNKVSAYIYTYNWISVGYMCYGLWQCLTIGLLHLVTWLSHFVGFFFFLLIFCFSSLHLICMFNVIASINFQRYIFPLFRWCCFRSLYHVKGVLIKQIRKIYI